jgi:integrase
MPRKPSGQVVERKWKAGRGYALRVSAYSERHYVTLGLERDGWTRDRAEEELQNVLADVRRAIWIPPDRSRPRATPQAAAANGDAPEAEPTFHEFASEWLASRQGEISPATYKMYGGALSYHLLPYFAHWRLSEIDIAAVDAYRRYKVAQADERRRALENGTAELNAGGNPLRPLSPTSINHTIDVLQMILALAVEYGHIPSNPAAGRRRRLKRAARRPIHLDSSQQIQALLDAAAELDHSPMRRTDGRRATVATLLFAGLRAAELCNLRWRDVDLANGRMHIGCSKTQAGLREIPLLPVLRDELATHKAAADRAGPDDVVFPTSTGGLRDKDNLRKRVLAPILLRADELLTERGDPPLPAGVTPHKLRHTFASVLVACGEDPASVMAQLGHTDPKFTLRVYTHLMRRDAGERARLRALVSGEQLDAGDAGAEHAASASGGQAGATTL